MDKRSTHNKINALASHSYFTRVVTEQDWQAADRSDRGWIEFGSHFPMTYPEHKEIVKMWKQQQRKEKRK